jgi:hypothetical protein
MCLTTASRRCAVSCSLYSLSCLGFAIRLFMTGVLSMVISLKHLIRKRLSIQEMKDLFVTLHNESDHSVAIVGAAYVEVALREALLFRMRSDLSKTDEGDLFDGLAPLSSFSAKIKLSYALGLFGAQTRYDLDTIKEIRNVFSHATAGASFSMDDIKSSCCNIGFWRRLSMNQGK